MDHVLALFVTLLVLAAVLATIAIRAPLGLFRKVVAVAVVALLIPLSYAALADLLSRPKPIGLEWANLKVDEANVLGSQIREGEGIYLWLGIAGLDEPRAYVLPWNRDLAQQLQDAQRAAKKNRNGLKMRKPFEASQENDQPTFHAPPQPAPPEKQVPTGAPLHYSRPGGQG